MPVNFYILPDRGLVVVRYSGFAAIEDSIAASKSYIAHPVYAAGQKQLVDMTQITGYEKDYVQFMNMQAEKAERFVRSVACRLRRPNPCQPRCECNVHSLLGRCRRSCAAGPA